MTARHSYSSMPSPIHIGWLTQWSSECVRLWRRNDSFDWSCNIWSWSVILTAEASEAMQKTVSGQHSMMQTKTKIIRSRAVRHEAGAASNLFGHWSISIWSYMGAWTYWHQLYLYFVASRWNPEVMDATALRGIAAQNLVHVSIWLDLERPSFGAQ